MPSTTASNPDTELLDALDHAIMNEALRVEIERVILPCGAAGWRASFTTDAVINRRNVVCRGGGRTVREALQKAFTDRVTKRLDKV